MINIVTSLIPPLLSLIHFINWNLHEPIEEKNMYERLLICHSFCSCSELIYIEILCGRCDWCVYVCDICDWYLHVSIKMHWWNFKKITVVCCAKTLPRLWVLRKINANLNYIFLTFYLSLSALNIVHARTSVTLSVQVTQHCILLKRKLQQFKCNTWSSGVSLMHRASIILC